ncbi:MAG TPA: cytochrome P450 [Polyangiaceae bacterium]|nr:cytochrome P450 [Polyangiaceae bacterium]
MAPLFNPFDPAYQADPYPTFHQMRSTEPVHWSEMFQAWFLTRYRHVELAARDPRLSSARRTSSFCRSQFGQAGLEPSTVEQFMTTSDLKMDEVDPPEHGRIRKNANPAFRPASLDAMRPRIQAAVDDLLDRAPKDRFDLAATLADPLPWTVICEILGIPAAERQKLKSWTKAFALMFASPIDALEVNGRSAEEAVRGFHGYFTAMVRERQASPGDDLMSHLGQAVRGGVMTEGECVAQIVLLLSAGSSTVSEQISNGVHDLLTHPDALATLKSRPDLTPTAVEEMLRHQTPIPFLNRIATEDLEIGGTPIHKGQVVFLGFGAGNRDPEIFPDPDRFDITRKGAGHLAFGYGAHFCIGANLARIQIEALVRSLLERTPEIRLDPAAAPVLNCDSLMFRGFKSLPVVVR